MALTYRDLFALKASDLLQIRLCDLPLEVTELRYFDEINKALLRLKKKRIVLEPFFWFSTEWFCPDGTQGIAIPFYLGHPRLEALEREMMGTLEGGSRRSFQKILWHELGHVVDNAFHLRKEKVRQKIFGSSRQEYPYEYDFVLHNRAFVKNLGEAYAQSHPDEDFAETFAVWLRGKSHWGPRYKGTPAFQKLQVMDLLLKSVSSSQGRLKGRASPPLKNKKAMDPLPRLKITLGEYYRLKRRYYKRDRFKMFDKGIKALLPRKKQTSLKAVGTSRIPSRWASPHSWATHPSSRFHLTVPVYPSPVNVTPANVTLSGRSLGRPLARATEPAYRSRLLAKSELKRERQLKRQWREHLKKQGAGPLYKIDPILKGILERSTHFGRGFDFLGPRQEKKWLAYLTKQTKAYFERGLDRVIL